VQNASARQQSSKTITFSKNNLDQAVLPEGHDIPDDSYQAVVGNNPTFPWRHFWKQGDVALSAVRVPRPLRGLLLYLTALSATPPCVWQLGLLCIFTNAVGIHSLRSNTAGYRWRWGEYCSEIKEEAKGWGTFAEACIPVA
jgi:hypothetical protein